MKLTFGKYKGQTLDSVPIDYLHWVYDNCKRINPKLKTAIGKLLEPDKTTPDNSVKIQELELENQLLGIEKTRAEQAANQLQAQLDCLRERIHQTYSKLAKVAHPDRGGDTRIMQVINDEFEKLR